jgi:hypothetical protein
MYSDTRKGHASEKGSTTQGNRDDWTQMDPRIFGNRCQCLIVKCGRVAQLAEQCPFKAWVDGSSPSALTKVYQLLRDHQVRGSAGRSFFALLWPLSQYSPALHPRLSQDSPRDFELIKRSILIEFPYTVFFAGLSSRHIVYRVKLAPFCTEPRAFPRESRSLSWT